VLLSGHICSSAVFIIIYSNRTIAWAFFTYPSANRLSTVTINVLAKNINIPAELICMEPSTCLNWLICHICWYDVRAEFVSKVKNDHLANTFFNSHDNYHFLQSYTFCSCLKKVEKNVFVTTRNPFEVSGILILVITSFSYLLR
jgi:hypothetical protein